MSESGFSLTPQSGLSRFSLSSVAETDSMIINDNETMYGMVSTQACRSAGEEAMFSMRNDRKSASMFFAFSYQILCVGYYSRLELVSSAMRQSCNL